jgi:hypothetical protein
MSHLSNRYATGIWHLHATCRVTDEILSRPASYFARAYYRRSFGPSVIQLVHFSAHSRSAVPAAPRTELVPGYAPPVCCSMV